MKNIIALLLLAALYGCSFTKSLSPEQFMENATEQVYIVRPAYAAENMLAVSFKFKDYELVSGNPRSFLIQVFDEDNEPVFSTSENTSMMRYRYLECPTESKGNCDSLHRQVVWNIQLPKEQLSVKADSLRVRVTEWEYPNPYTPAKRLSNENIWQKTISLR